jgi:SSS family solute:Na+ symporter
LLLGVMVFVFYQFQTPPIVFNRSAWEANAQLESNFAAAHERASDLIVRWIDAEHAGQSATAATVRLAAQSAEAHVEELRGQGLKITAAKSRANDDDYVFITFILNELPHGFIGLLIAAFFGAALSSKAAELNSLSSSTTVDIYRNLVRRNASDRHYLAATKTFTIFWGFCAIAFALFLHLPDNLVEAVNIIGSLFYGVILGLFIAGFFFPRVTAGPVFWAAIVSQLLVLWLYFTLTISYLWLIPIGCLACVAGALVLQPLIGPAPSAGAGE